MRDFSRQGSDLERCTPLLRAAAAHEVDEQTAHRAACISEEAGTVGEYSAGPRGEVQIRFVQQRRRTQGEQRTAPQLALGKPVQLTVQRCEQPVARAGLAVLGLPDQLLELLLQHAAKLPAADVLSIEHAQLSAR